MARMSASVEGFDCPFCFGGIEPAVVFYCPRCTTPHHFACFQLEGGCAITGCGGRFVPEPTQDLAPPKPPSTGLGSPDRAEVPKQPPVGPPTSPNPRPLSPSGLAQTNAIGAALVPSPSPRPTSADLISSGESRQGPTPRYSLTTAWVLWAVALLGVAGLNRFYLGKRGTGLLWLLTWGLLGIGIVYDALTMQTQVAQANATMASASPTTTVRRIDPMRAPTRASHEEKEGGVPRPLCQVGRGALLASHHPRGPQRDVLRLEGRQVPGRCARCNQTRRFQC